MQHAVISEWGFKSTTHNENDSGGWGARFLQSHQMAGGSGCCAGWCRGKRGCQGLQRRLHPPTPPHTPHRPTPHRQGRGAMPLPPDAVSSPLLPQRAASIAALGPSSEGSLWSPWIRLCRCSSFQQSRRLPRHFFFSEYLYYLFLIPVNHLSWFLFSLCVWGIWSPRFCGT